MTALPKPSHSYDAEQPRALPLPGAGAAPALTAEHHAQLAAARIAYRPIARALRVVTFSAVTLALFAVLSLPFAFFGFKAAFAALGLTVAAVFEFRGRTALRRLEPAGIRILTWNQIALTGVLAIYCLWSMADAWFGPNPYADVIASDPAVGELLAPYSDLCRQLAVGTYAAVLVIGGIVQGLVIRYYATRRLPLEKYLAATPAWVLAWNRA